MGKVAKWLRDKHYVYLLVGPDDVPFYVGCGTGGRAWDRRASGRGRACWEHMQQIWTAGGAVKHVFVATGDAETMSRLERELIEQLGRVDLGTGPLTNLIEGGRDGFAKTDDHKKRIATALIGVKHTSERKSRISAALKGRKTAPRGPHSTERRERIRVAALRRWARYRGEC